MVFEGKLDPDPKLLNLTSFAMELKIDK